MSTTNNNPKIAAIQESLQDSYARLNQLLDGPLTTLSTDQLYVAPLDNEWTLMENLAHINEFLPYWGDEIEKLVAHPGQNFGRTQQQERRLRAIVEHGTDSLTQVRSQLPQSYAHLMHIINHLKDSDLDLMGHHPKFGDCKLEWFIEEFLTKHFADHLEQMKQVFTALEKKPGK